MNIFRKQEFYKKSFRDEDKMIKIENQKKNPNKNEAEKSNFY